MEARSTARVLTYLGFIALIGFVALQFVLPPLKNPPVTAELQAPPEVKRVLKNSCYSCHSNETQLPWFDRIAPASWLVASDVKEAREHLNFSEIGKLPAAQQMGALYEAVNQAQLGAMPLPRYTFVHPHARITAEDIAVLKNYLHPPAPEAAPDEAGKIASAAQYDQWIHASRKGLNVQPELNGMQFFPGYRDWKVVSTTNRFDNHTLRVISGNEIAMHAIAEHHMNPWPDGTVFAKTAWTQQVDTNGDTKTGSFLQVEFMVKDSRKYSATGGWGYGRWRGMDLKPYGKDAKFVNECAGCHNPVRKDDYVYTFPLAGQQ